MVTGDVEFRSHRWPELLMSASPETLDAGSLFASHHDRIYRYILRMMRNASEAEDLTQETFLRAYQRRDSLRDALAARGWLYRIATHVCLDRLRQHRHDVSLDSEGAGDRVARLSSALPSLVEVAERQETSRCVQRCLDFLPDTYRAILLLHLAHKLTATEIAGLLGLKLSTVKMRLHRARHSLQQIMACGCAVSNDKQGHPVCQPKS
jgi:RNA polymerase sigma-70 factor, ECF subfamily